MRSAAVTRCVVNRLAWLAPQRQRDGSHVASGGTQRADRDRDVVYVRVLLENGILMRLRNQGRLVTHYSRT